MLKINKLKNFSNMTYVAPKRLWGDYWFENEICLLFSDSNTGKSTLSMDIAVAVAGGNNYLGDNFRSEVKGNINVIYFDLEHTDLQFYNKYHALDLNLNIKRVSIDYTEFAKLEVNEMLGTIKSNLEIGMHNVVIIDPIGCSGVNIFSHSKVADFIYELKNARELVENVSILLLAHTNKRNMKREITQNDLGGAKSLINYCDSAFALGESVKEPDLRYIKQIKARNVSKYDLVAEVCLVSEPYPHFEMEEWNEESEHLQFGNKRSSKIDQNMKSTILLLYPNKSLRQIASQLNISKSSVQRVVKNSLLQSHP